MRVFGSFVPSLVLGFWLFLALSGAPAAAAGEAESAPEVLELPPVRIGPGYFKMAAVTDPETGRVQQAEVAWVARELPQLKRGDRLVFIDGRPIAGMSLSDFEAYARGLQTPGERIILVFKGTRGWLRKREVTIELELVSTAEAEARVN